MSEEEETDSKKCIYLTFLAELGMADRAKLLQKPSCAFFTFRMIPPMAQQIIVQLIWKGNVPSDENIIDSVTMRQWLDLLESLGIVVRNDSAPDARNKWVINDSFRRAYMYAVMSGSARISNLKMQELDEKKKQKDVGKKALERWDCILRYLALPSEQNMSSVSATTRSLFRSANFTSGDGEKITTTGFQFLLLSPVQQMWTYVIEYLKLEISNGKDSIELLELLIQIVLCANKGFEPGNEAFVLDSNWSDRQMDLINHLRELGVIFIRKRKDGIFFLTPLLAHLATNELSADNTIEKASNGTIIVETNFRLYAYTSSPLQLAILSTFTEMTYSKKSTPWTEKEVHQMRNAKDEKV